MKGKRVIGKKISIDTKKIGMFFADRARKYDPKHPEVSMLYRDNDPKEARKMSEKEKSVLLPLMNPGKSDRILDIGCGIGRWAEILAKRSAYYHGTDITGDLIDIAKDRCKKFSNVSFQTIAAEGISVNTLAMTTQEGFDKIIVAGVLHYVNDRSLEIILKNIREVSGSQSQVFIRGPIALEERLTLNDVWSEELEHYYSSIYRTREEMRNYFHQNLPDFEITVDQPLFPDALNYREETRQHLFILTKKSKIKTAYCFDLDGTITKQEILPLLSHEVGLHEEISALTEATIKGVIPFYRSFLLRCKLLSDIPITKVRNIIRKIDLNENIVTFIREHKDDCFIVTGNLDVWVAPLVNKIGCRFYCSEAEVKGTKLTGVSKVLDKSEPIKELKNRFDRIVAVGDGMGDVAMFENSDIRIAFGGAHHPVETLRKSSDFIVYKEESLCRLLNTL